MTEKELLLEMMILGARRQVHPSMQDSKRMREIFSELYFLTKKDIYKLNPL
jgi:hypothetical protein